METIIAIELETHSKPKCTNTYQSKIEVTHFIPGLQKTSIPYAWISIRSGWMKMYSQWNTIIFVTCKYCVNSKLQKKWRLLVAKFVYRCKSQFCSENMFHFNHQVMIEFYFFIKLLWNQDLNNVENKKGGYSLLSVLNYAL